jgi:hypothetical protein
MTVAASGRGCRDKRIASVLAVMLPLRVSIRQHTTDSIRVRERLQRQAHRVRLRSYASAASAYVSICQHTTAYVSIRQHTGEAGVTRACPSCHVCVIRCSCARTYTRRRQHTSAYVSGCYAPAARAILKGSECLFKRTRHALKRACVPPHAVTGRGCSSLRPQTLVA